MSEDVGKKKVSKWKTKRKLTPAKYVPPEPTGAKDDSFFRLAGPGESTAENDDASKPQTTTIREEVEVIDILDPDYEEKMAEQNKRRKTQTPDQESSVAEDKNDAETDVQQPQPADDGVAVVAVDVDEEEEEEGEEEDATVVSSRERDPLSGVLSEDMDAAMLERIRRKREAARHQSAFPVSVEVKVEIRGLGGFGRGFDMQSNERFRDVRRRLLEHVATGGIASGSASYRAVQEGYFMHESVRVFDSSSPMSLNISRYTPTMQVSLMTPEDFEARQRAVEEEYARKREQALQEQRERERQEREDEERAARAAADAAEEEEGEAGDAADAAAAGDDGFFTVYMKGKDNEAVGVQVNAETEIKKLAAYYKKKKGLPDNAEIRLEFDDEDLPADGVVGDTELEEDYSIDVYVS
ncbi:hypothetical protein TRICI_006775 [Trichomonascus ciferrii]|uniref:Rad60/SUMO-like domain-containing protein n=1 Tax=Trichomonascus ciferrii TaxID=44093 RepID=A0A642UDC0_9ASCO|nr:hypothetical protein TRICI_006775 [Trichomonascus ciferrii]